MNKRETVKEIARVSHSASVSRVAQQALKGEVSLDRALHHTANHSGKAYSTRIANEAIDKG